MPYFKWTGVSLDGKIKSGMLRARSYEDLDLQLYNRDIGRMRATLKSVWPWERITATMHASFFKQLSVLVDSGIYIDKALEMIAQQITHRHFREILQDATSEVQNGSTLAYALAQSGVFSQVCLQILQAGQESGKLSEALEMLFVYTNRRQELYKKIRQALLVPSVTLAVFCFTAALILITVVPAIASFFETTGKQLPVLTKTVLAASRFIQRFYGIGFVVGGLCVWVCVRFFVQRYVRKYLQLVLLKLPFIGPLVSDIGRVSYLYAVSLLIQGRVSVVQSLMLARESVLLDDLNNRFKQVESKVDAGLPVHQAFQEADCIAPDLIGMIMIGEQSGTLGRMFMRTADWYTDRLNRQFLIIHSLIQPTLMIILAILVVALIVAVYLPLFDLSMVVT